MFNYFSVSETCLTTSAVAIQVTQKIEYCINLFRVYTNLFSPQRVLCLSVLDKSIEIAFLIQTFLSYYENFLQYSTVTYLRPGGSNRN